MTFHLEHVADSFELLTQLEDGDVDVVITDPPYNEHVHKNMTSGTALRKVINGEEKRGGIPRVQSTFSHLEGYAFAEDLVRVAKRWAVSFCAVEDFARYKDVVGDAYVRGGIWFKPNSMGQLTKDRPAVAYEGLAVMHRKGRKTWNGRGSWAYWVADADDFLPSEETHFVCNGTRGEEDRHPNQKPLELCLELVAKFSQRGETVLDPFAGSGRIGEACVLLGRQYVGFDADPVWVGRAQERLRAAEWLVAESGGVLDDSACLKLCSWAERAGAKDGGEKKPRAPRAKKEKAA